MSSGKSGKVTNIRKYRRPLNINIGMVIFAVIFIYIVVCVVMYFRQNPVRPYEVKEGSLSTSNVYTGIAIREEEVVTAQSAGYVNYYAREGERVAVGNLVYTVDETGRLSDYLNNEETGENSLSDSDLAQLKNDIVNFKHNFQSENFASAYDFKYSVKGMVLKLANNSLMSGIKDINGSSDLADLVDFCYTGSTGIVEYWVDGFEALKANEVTAASFDTKNYEKKQLISNELIAQGESAYKLSTNEIWSIVIPIDEARGRELLEEEFVKVRFLKNQAEIWGEVSLLNNSDGTYLQLQFTNSMVTFAGDRYLEVELIVNESKGLKIPNSSIVEMEFFLVPEAYITQSGSSKSSGVLREKALEDGTVTSEYVETSLYSLKDGEYYVDTSTLRTGDRLLMPDSTETYIISKRATLIGVYNMNKGYADFRQIEIINQNDEYAIVKSNTMHGLNVYDLIVLEASSVNEDQFVYE